MAKSDEKTDLKTASVLAFERKLDPSDATLSSGKWEQRDNASAWPAIAIREKSVRGTISNRLKTKDQDPAKLDASIQSPNIQTVDVAALPPTADTLRVQFTLRVLGGTGVPSACNSSDYQASLRTVVDSYVTEAKFQVLAERYAHNLANGRFLWRNRIGAEEVEVRIRKLQGGKETKSWTFNALKLSLRNFDVPSDYSEALTEISTAIAQALTGASYLLLEVTAFLRVGTGQEVFPSQELILDKGSKKGSKSKTLYKVGETAAMHSQKIGNAIRTIDTWYPCEDVAYPIAVEPYGSVTSQGKAWRQPKQKFDFYSLLDAWVLKGNKPQLDQQHYVMATLVRGGVFGEKAE